MVVCRAGARWTSEHNRLGVQAKRSMQGLGDLVQTAVQRKRTPHEQYRLATPGEARPKHAIGCPVRHLIHNEVDYLVCPAPFIPEGMV